MAAESDACAAAHGASPSPVPQPSMAPGTASRESAAAAQAGEPAARTLVAVFASPVSGYLLRYAADAGFRTLLVEPDAGRAEAARMAGFPGLTAIPDDLEHADVVGTDHHR